jgi:hypothetical protein
MKTRLAWAAMVAAMGAWAQEGRVEGPLLGYVVDPGGSLRTLAGMPGSSLLGRPLDLGLTLERTQVSPQQDYALADGGAATGVVLARLGREASPVVIPDAPTGVQRIVLSPTGAAAALYYEGKILIVGGLRGSPSVTGEVDVSGVAGPIGAIAVRDDGSAVLIAASDGVYWGTPPEPARFLLAMGRVVAIAFRPDSGEAAVVDGERNQVYAVRDGELLPLAGEREGVAGPVAVAWSGNGSRLMVANGAGRSVLVVDREGGAIGVVPCECEPAGLQRLAGNAVFRLTDASGEPMWLFDGDAVEPRVVFVVTAGEEQ